MKNLVLTFLLLASTAAHAERTETIVSDTNFEADVLVRTIHCRQGIDHEHFPVPTVVTIPTKRLTSNFRVDRLLLQNTERVSFSLSPATKCEEFMATLQDQEYIRVQGNKKVIFFASLRNDHGLNNECQVTAHEDLSIDFLGHEARGANNLIILPADPKFCAQ